MTAIRIVELPRPKLIKYPKSNLAEEIMRMANMFHPKIRSWAYCCQLENGKVKMLDNWDKTILELDYFLVAKVKINFLAEHDVRISEGVELSPDENMLIYKDAEEAVHRNFSFFIKEAKFVIWLMKNEKRLDGLTPAVAAVLIHKEFRE